LLTAGSTRLALDQHRDALALAVNHLSWNKELVLPKPIDSPVDTVFVVDIRKLGWQRRPFTRLRDGKGVGPSHLNLFDLVLLEYPYAVLYEGSPTFDDLAREFLAPADQVRPVVYVRADWFVSVATQPPLYEDLLQLPFDLKGLEETLGVQSEANVADGIAHRGGLAVSGVSHHNRVVERHPGSKTGYYWKSFDFRSSKGRDNIFADPVDLAPAGGELIFGLPNGLQGYLLVNGKGERLEAAPTDVVTDRFAADKAVRNGLACMRCHDRGMKLFADAVRQAVEKLPGVAAFDRKKALQLYPGQADLDRLLKADGDHFTGALKAVLGRPPQAEPLGPVSQRFLDAPLLLTTAGAELGLPGPDGLRPVFRTPGFAALGLVPLASEGAIRRDTWEDYYDQVVRLLGLGAPVLPLDGLTRRDHRPAEGLDVRLATNRRGNIVESGDKMVLFVTNHSRKDVYVELVGTDSRGKKVILVPSTKVVRAGEKLRFPTEGGIEIGSALGRDQVTLFASDAPFPGGEVLRGDGVADRVVHQFFGLRLGDGPPRVIIDPARVLKKTIDIETR
jgi:serine/threonine-protein kinase